MLRTELLAENDIPYLVYGIRRIGYKTFFDILGKYCCTAVIVDLQCRLRPYALGNGHEPFNIEYDRNLLILTKCDEEFVIKLQSAYGPNTCSKYMDMLDKVKVFFRKQ